jgi:hypothetical protein
MFVEIYIQVSPQDASRVVSSRELSRVSLQAIFIQKHIFNEVFIHPLWLAEAEARSYYGFLKNMLV